MYNMICRCVVPENFAATQSYFCQSSFFWEAERERGRERESESNEWVGGTINVTTFTYTNMLHHVMQLQEPSRLGAHRSTDCASHCRCGQSHLNQNQHTLHVTIWWRRGSLFSEFKFYLVCLSVCLFLSWCNVVWVLILIHIIALLPFKVVFSGARNVNYACYYN